MANMSAWDDLSRVFFDYLMVLGLSSARLVVAIAVIPAFTRLGITGIRRLCIGLALSLPVAWHLQSDLALFSAMRVERLVVLEVKESLVGLLLGLAFGLPFWAAAAAGDVLDFQRGALMAYVADPGQKSEIAVSGTLLQLVVILLFYTGGGANLLLSALYDSYRLWPPVETLPQFSKDAPEIILHFLDRLMTLALLLGAPLFLVLFMVEIAMALVARMAPQLRVFDLSLPIKAIALFAVIPIYFTFYTDRVAAALTGSAGVLEAFRRIFL